jgi:hypothetical protein
MNLETCLTKYEFHHQIINFEKIGRILENVINLKKN